MMHEPEKSDSVVVAGKPTNKAEQSAAEPAEPRTETKGTRASKARAGRRTGQSVSQALERVRQVARQRKKERFTSLLLRTAFYAMKREAAPGVDGMTWETYEEHLDRRIEDLHAGQKRSVPGTTVASELHSEGRRQQAPACGRRSRGQDRPEGHGCVAERDLRGGFPRVQCAAGTHGKEFIMD